MSGHPDRLALDRWALGDASDEALRAHLLDCASCNAHLEKVSAGAAGSLPPALGARLQRDPFWRRARWQLLFALPSLAAALWLIVPRHSTDETAKGMPSLALYVERSGSVSLWDGQRPLHPGDRVELQISADGFRFAAVGAGVDTTRWLYRGPIDPARVSLVPASFRLDDAPGSEALGVVLSDTPLDDAALGDAILHRARDAHVWTSLLQLPKETP